MSKCREVFQRQRLERFAFDVEVLYIARKWGLKIAEVPVVWRHAEGSKVRLFPDAPLTGLDLLRIRWSDLRGLYGSPGLV
jgi:dolichyl-phosphate beta-glucosyltransferase